MQEEVSTKIAELLDDVEYAKAKELTLGIPQGKMLRSKLIEAVAGKTAESIKLAAIVELIHLASLLHDDVIDRADKRRGMESINHKYGDIYAVMLGDILYSKAFYELSFMEQEVAQTLSLAVNRLSVGELMDVEYSAVFNPDKALYYKIIYLKTGVLIEAAIACAAKLVGKDGDKLAVYGKNIGIAFQIADDVLDVTQDEKTLGKPAFSDFREGKSTLPFIFLHESLEVEGQNRLKALCGQDFSKADEDWIKEGFVTHGSIAQTKESAMMLVKEALAVADGEERLLEIAMKMVDRKF